MKIAAFLVAATASGKRPAKYDVRRLASGGEYPNQDGLGRTDGITRARPERRRA